MTVAAAAIIVMVIIITQLSTTASTSEAVYLFVFYKTSPRIVVVFIDSTLDFSDNDLGNRKAGS